MISIRSDLELLKVKVCVLFTKLFVVPGVAPGIQLFFPQIFVAHLNARNIAGIQLYD